MTRFQKLGKLIVDRKPDNIVDLGDFVSMSAISSWDMSKRLKMEGRRYQLDVKFGKMAYDEIFSPLESLQSRQRKAKAKLYAPVFEKMDGNHEGWTDRYLEQNPELVGALDLNADLGLTARGITPNKYKEILKLNGINFLHCPIAGNDMPISGLHIPYKALQRFNNHVVMGHYHRSETSSIRRTDAKNTTRAISCPAFFSGQPHYLSPNAPCVINSGVILIHQDDETMWPEVEEISMSRLYCEY